jgi:hypothetical protein
VLCKRETMICISFPLVLCPPMIICIIMCALRHVYTNCGNRRMRGVCSTRWYLEIWSLGPPWWCWDMSSVGRSRMHCSYFSKRNRKVCCQTSLLSWGILNACTRIVALEEGRCVHEQISHSGCGSHVFVGNSSVELYAKCGSLKDTGRLSNKMPSYDVVT